MSLKHGLLGLLDDESMTGYDLMKVFNHSLSFFWSAQTSQIYRDLTNLEKNGLLTSNIEKQSGKPDKKLYTITEAGRNEFHQWLNEYNFTKPGNTRDGMLMNIFFGAKGSKKKLIEGLNQVIEISKREMAQQSRINKLIDEYAQLDDYSAKGKIYWEITALKKEIFTKANIDWATRAISILNGEDK